MSDCLFCKIINKQIKASVEYEDQDILIFRDINPQAPVHVLVIPKKHIESIGQLQQADLQLVGKVIYGAKSWAATNGYDDYRLLFNNGNEAGQTVFHLHLHLLSGRKMNWPPG